MKGPVRNREIDKAAEALAERHVLPKPPAKTLNWEQMQQYFALLTPEMWSHLIVYVYRLRPRIIRQLKDPKLPNYIDCLSEPFSMEYMIQRHGGGKYMCEVNDASNTKRGPGAESCHLFRCYAEIDEVMHEPKLNYEELDINHRENMSYLSLLQHRGVLDNKGQVVNNNQQASGNGMNTEVIKEILGFVSKLNSEQQTALRSKLGPDEDSLGKSVGNILLEKMKQEDPTKQVAMLSELLKALKEIVGTSKPNDNSGVFDRLIQMQAEYNKTILELMKEHRREPRPTEGAGDNWLENVDKIFSVMDRFQGLRGGGGRRTGWDIGLDYARELVVPGLQTLNNFLAMRTGKPITPITPTPAPGAFDPYANPQALRQHAQALTTPPQAAAPAAPGAPAAPPAAAPGNELVAVLQQYGSLVVNALNNGTPGYDFADYLCGLLGTATHAMLSGQGEPALLQTAMSVPELSMFGEPRLRTFIHEFVCYEQFLQDAETAEEKVA